MSEIHTQELSAKDSFGTIQCGSCDREVARIITFCPYCGKPCAPPEVNTGADGAANANGNVIHAVFGSAGITNAQSVALKVGADTASDQSPPSMGETSAPSTPFPTPSDHSDTPHPTPSVAETTSTWEATTPNPAAATVPARPAPRRKPLIIASAILMAVIAIYSWIPRGAFVVPAATTLYVVRSDTIVRDAPTSQSSRVISTIDRGAQVTGIWQTSGAGRTSWLKLSDGPHQGNYIWERNLSTSMPPEMTQIINDFRVTRVASTIRYSPDMTAAVLENVRPGLSIYVAGEVAGGWTEIPMKRGGVGYISSFDLR